MLEGAKRPDAVRISHSALTSDKRLGRAGRAGRRELAGLFTPFQEWLQS